MSPNRLSWRYVSADAAALALDPIAMIGDWVASRVNAAPVAPPRRSRNVLRIIREPFRCRVLPTTGLDRRESRPYETRYRGPADWIRPLRSTSLKQLAGRSP